MLRGLEILVLPDMAYHLPRRSLPAKKGGIILRV